MSDKLDKLDQLNLGLNDGTYAPQAAIDALRSFDSRTSLRNYTTSENDPLRETIARIDGVRAEHVFLRNGSGPILKQVIPHVIRKAITSSPIRIARHVVRKNGFPIITPRHTYSKVPRKAANLGLTVHFLRLDPPHFRLDISELDGHLKKQDGLVYISNPNNPTGNVLITREQLIPLLERYHRSKFWIDEAYVHYVDPKSHRYCADLVTAYPNLMVSRTLSFAYGLAGLRVGYLLATPPLVRELQEQLTDYRIGLLAERVSIAALEDEAHLPFVREETRKERDKIQAAVNELRGVEAFDSQANFVLCRRTDGQSAQKIADSLAQRGIRIKTFTPIADQRYDEYFRLTVGLTDENDRLLAEMREILG